MLNLVKLRHVVSVCLSACSSTRISENLQDLRMDIHTDRHTYSSVIAIFFTPLGDEVVNRDGGNSAHVIFVVGLFTAHQSGSVTTRESSVHLAGSFVETKQHMVLTSPQRGHLSDVFVHVKMSIIVWQLSGA